VVLGPLFLNSGSHSRPTFERSGIMGGKEKFLASKYGIIFGYPFEGCTRGLDCERRHVVLGPLFLNSGSRSRPMFERSGIMGGKAKFLASKYGIIFGYPFEGCTVVLIASEDVWFLGHFFSTLGHVLGPCLNEVGLWVEKKSSPLPNMESYLDTHLRVAPVVLIASEDVWFLGRFFSTLGPVLGPRLNGVGLWVEKQSSLLPNMESYLDTHLRVAPVVLIVNEDVWFLGLFFPTLGPVLGPTFERSGIMGGKAKFPLPNMESYLDTHLRVAPMVLIASEDVWFLGLFFPTPGPVLGPRLNEVGLWVEKKSSPLPNMESYLDTHLRVAPVVLIASEDVWFLGLFFPTLGPVLGPRLNEVGLWVEKQSSSLPNMESYLDTHLRVAPVVLIASEDVWFLGHFFPTPCPVLGPCLNEVGLWVEKQSSPLPNTNHIWIPI
jgi:hypothetical protein